MKKRKILLATEDKKQSDATINIELREKSVIATLIKANLHRDNLDSVQREELKGTAHLTRFLYYRS
jgi:hypothetical protein